MAAEIQQKETVNHRIGSAYFSLQRETPEPVEANIRGDIPTWIDGCLLRNGPGKYELGDQQMNYLFDGLSVLHRFDISNGKVTYQNRFQRSDAYVLGMEKNRVVLSEFGTAAYPDPCLNIFQRVMSRFTTAHKPTDNCNVNVYRIGDEFFACTENTTVRKINPETLETLNKVDMAEVLALHSATAHPHTSLDGVVYNMGSTYGRKNMYNIVRIPPTTQKGDHSFRNMSIVASIPQSLHRLFPSYSHSFGVTDKYFVLLEQPLLFNVFKILKARVLSEPMIPALEFHSEMKANFHLVERDSGTILPTTYEADAFFCFHHINAYEDDGHVVVDLICYTDPSSLNMAYLKDLRNGVTTSANAESRRFVLPLDIEGKTLETNLNALLYSKAKSILKNSNTVVCTYDVICDQAIDLPQINYRLCNGKPYRYFYAIGTKNVETLIKADTRNGSSIQWHEDFCLPSEPVFVGRPGSTTEDDGILLSSVIDAREGHHPFLLILDARDFQEIGRAEVPVEVPSTFHGIFVPRGTTSGTTS